MKVTLTDGRVYHLWFRYIRIFVPETNSEHRMDTLCLLQPAGDNSGEPTVGHAGLDSRDRFIAEKGRKIALKRALDTEGLSYEDRTVIWQQYHNRPRGSAHAA